MNTLPETCPLCGAEKSAEMVAEPLLNSAEYDCGSEANNWTDWTDDFARTALCVEREARQKVEAELEKVIEQKNNIIDILNDAIYHIAHKDTVNSSRYYQSRLNTLEGKL